MTRTPLLAALAFTFAFSAGASAAGFNLAWNDCGSFGTPAKIANCTNSGGANISIVSLIPGPGIDHFVAAEGVIDLQTSDSALSPWWQMQVGGCRQGALSASTAFGAFTNCLVPWLGRELDAVDYSYPLFGGPNRARIRLVSAQPTADAGPLASGTEYYLFQVVINRQKTTGSGACAGCPQQVILELVELRITQTDPVPILVITQPNQPNSNRIVWAGDASVPVRNRAWAAIKAIYH